MFDHTADPDDVLLSVLARADAAALKAEAEAVLPLLGELDVIQSRTGLVMLPMRDPVQGTEFHLGEVLVAEAHIRLPGPGPHQGTEGYGMIIGRDLERAMAMALLDAALQSGIAADRIHAFITAQRAAQEDDDRETLRRIAATRVDMETF